MTIHTMTETERTAYLEAQVAKLTAINDSLRRAAVGKVTLKVGKAGGVSMYGMGRYPVTLYRSQWERLIQAVPQVQAFIEAHASELSTKAE